MQECKYVTLKQNIEKMELPPPNEMTKTRIKYEPLMPRRVISIDIVRVLNL